MKKVYILRGVSGSGKSTFIKNLSLNKVVHSTDNYFYKNKKYIFNPKKLSFYHKKNFESFVESLKRKKRVVVVDNTNLLCEFVEPYINEAKKYGYKVILVDFIPKGREFHFRRNRHNVPIRVINEQFKNYKKCKNMLKVDKIIKKEIK